MRLPVRGVKRKHAHTQRTDRWSPGGPLCTLVTAEEKTGPFLTESPLLVRRRSVAREQCMPCFSGGQSVDVCR